MTSRHDRRFALLCCAVLAFACAPAAARATATPEAARVIARYLEVTGGAATAAAERTLYSRARVEGFGFSGRVEAWGARPDRHYSHTELGPFQLAEGTDGAVAWRTDPTTGRIVRLTDRDSSEARGSTWFELERWTEPDQGGGHAEVAAHERDSTGTYTVLAVSMSAAGDPKPRRLWFADATGLLAREEAPHDQSWIVSTFADWRTAAGRLRPFTTTTMLSTMTANVMTTVADSFAAGIDVTHVPFAPPDTSSGIVVRWLSHAGAATLPFEYRARHVWLRASLDGGPPEDFLLDTGASVTVLDSTFAAAHGIRTTGSMQAAGAGAAGNASFATVGALAVRGPDGDGVEVRDLKVAVMSVNPMFARFFWRDMAGVLGYDFISRFVVTLDYDRGVLELHDPAKFAYAGHEAPLPMKLNGVVPSVEAVFDGRYRGDFRLDIGSSSTVDVHAPFAKKHQLERRLAHARPVTGAGFGGQFETELGRLHRMAIGPYSWRDPMVSVARTDVGAFASEDFAGNIGNRVLERFRVTLDYEHRRIWLEPGRRYGDRDAFTRTGLLLGWYGDRIEAESVLSDSPAAKAGVRQGDRVTAVAGRPVLEWTPTALDELFDRGPDGRRVTVTVNREGHDETLTLKLREMLR